MLLFRDWSDSIQTGMLSSSEKWYLGNVAHFITLLFYLLRDWDAPEKADILVSELLGSFGDYELSPQCLDGAHKFLKGSHILLV